MVLAKTFEIRLREVLAALGLFHNSTHSTGLLLRSSDCAEASIRRTFVAI